MISVQKKEIFTITATIAKIYPYFPQNFSGRITECWKPYRHDAVIDHAAHLHVFQVAVLDVSCQYARDTVVGARGHDQPLPSQGLGQQLGLQLEADKYAGVI